MDGARQWKVVRRVKAIQHGIGVLPRLIRDVSTLIAGPFASVAAARSWIDFHPELGAGLVPAPILLPPRL
jgi:hypothetical protein